MASWQFRASRNFARADRRRTVGLLPDRRLGGRPATVSSGRDPTSFDHPQSAQQPPSRQAAVHSLGWSSPRRATSGCDGTCIGAPPSPPTNRNENADPRHVRVTGVGETSLAVVMGSLPRAARPQDEATQSRSNSGLRQSERQGVVAVARAERTMPACSDDDILAPIAPAVGHRGRLRACWQPCLPHHLA